MMQELAVNEVGTRRDGAEWRTASGRQMRHEGPLSSAETLAGMMQRERAERNLQIIIEAATAVHRELGPGLIEEAYAACLAYELAMRGLQVERRKPLAVTYRHAKVKCDYCLDLLVENEVVVELKAVDRLDPADENRLQACLRLAGFRLGLLINFNVIMLKNGVRKIVNAAY
jgi:GxxExxY protein